MAYKSWQGSRLYQPAEGDTLDAIAEREAAAGNAISAEDIARFNWGAEDPEDVQTLMRDELGARARDGSLDFVLSPDDQARQELRIPERAARSSSSTAAPCRRSHSISTARS